MRYKQLVEKESPVSILGFGTMRLPIDIFSGEIDKDKAFEIIDQALKLGINYFDTGFNYLGGRCEPFLREAFSPLARKSVSVVTKMPIWLIDKNKDLDKLFYEQLQRLGVDSFKYYLLHGLNRQSWLKVKDLNVLSWLDHKLKEGIISHIGFSFHDDYETFKYIVDGYSGWDFCQVQCNFLNFSSQAGFRGINFAAEKGLGVIVMGPLSGGVLADPPICINPIFDGSAKERIVSLAFRWLWNHPGVTMVLSGMNTNQQLIDNATYASMSEGTILNKRDIQIINEIRVKYSELVAFQCTNCAYCMPCPNGIDIPRNLEILNQFLLSKEGLIVRNLFTKIPEKHRATLCTKCSLCTLNCPQKINIPYWLGFIKSFLI